MCKKRLEMRSSESGIKYLFQRKILFFWVTLQAWEIKNYDEEQLPGVYIKIQVMEKLKEKFSLSENQLIFTRE